MAAGDRIQVALKPEVEAVATTAATTNTALGELDTRVQATEGFETRIDQLETDTGALDTAINDPSTGLVKQLSDVDAEINTADTGIKARLDDLEQGGVNTTKFRTHTPSGSYEDGEIVLVGRSQYRANNAMDGSTTPIPFVVGSGANQWQPVSVHNKEIDLEVNYSGVKMTLNPQILSSSDGSNMAGLVLDSLRKRVSVGVSGDGAQAALVDNDVLIKGEADDIYQPKGNESKAFGYNSDTSSDSYVDIAVLGNLTVKARYHSTEAATVRVTNSTGGSVGVIYSSNDDGSITNASTTTSDNANFTINRPSAANSVKMVTAGVYTSPGVNTEAYQITVMIRRLTSGVRIAGSITGTF